MIDVMALGLLLPADHFPRNQAQMPRAPKPVAKRCSEKLG
jgi:hypothetical protein